VVVTGASTGIGRAAAFALAKRGFHVVAGVRKEADAASIRTEAASTSFSAKGTVEPALLDVTNLKDIERMHAEVVAGAAARGEQVVGLVNNAGVASLGPIETLTRDEIMTMVNVNYVGVMDITRAFIGDIRRSSGRFIHVSSVAAELTNGNFAVYSTTKWAVRALSNGLRRELGRFGVHSCDVAPGWVKTPIMAGMEKFVEDASRLVGDQIEAYGPVYSTQYRDMLYADSNSTHQTTDATDEAIVHCMTNAHPQSHYLVISPANTALAIIRYLPDWVMDRISDLLTGQLIEQYRGEL
jgi:NAD(P)-dependent dehydrogenase (short-subunit alcohol dehydrogenase family)